MAASSGFQRQAELKLNRLYAAESMVDLSALLGHWFGTSAEFWMNLHLLYELRRTRAAIGERVEKLPTLATGG